MSQARVLIVEDELIVIMDLKIRLKHMGYTVYDQATSGEEALEKVTESKPDLIIMDITLAGKLSGIETVERIHRDQFIPVVFLTADGHKSKFAQSKITLPYERVLKPFEDSALKNAIERMLSIPLEDL